MPWQESCAMDQRVALISDWRTGHFGKVELADRYGISRKAVYKWLDRYEREGPAGLADRSSAPLVHGRATDEMLVEMIVQQREARPRWGPRMIIAKLSQLHPDLAWPAPSTAGDILKRAGLVDPRRRRHRAPPTLGGLTWPERPNHVWAVDHKGWRCLGDGQRLEPLTISDSFSRYLIGLSAGASTREEEARPVF